MNKSLNKYFSLVLLCAFFCFGGRSVMSQSLTQTPVQRQLVISGSVPAKISDFSLDFVTNPYVETVGQYQEITFVITYGSSLLYSTPLTIQAQWYLGSPIGEDPNTFDVVSYVPGSASAAENGTQPFVNLLDRTITWNIDSFPANTTGRTVTFKLITPQLRISTADLEFDVKARLFTTKLALPDDVLSFTHIPSDEFAATPTPSLSPSSGTTTSTEQAVQATATQTPTPIPNSVSDMLQITKIELLYIDSETATLFVTTNRKSKIEVHYGSNMNLIDRVTDNQYLSKRRLILDPLTPGTVYYVRLFATGENGQKAASGEYFVFRTPTLSAIKNGSRRNFYLGSSGVVKNHNFYTNAEAIVVFPKNVTAHVVLEFGQNAPARADIRLVNNRVLGINNFTKAIYRDRVRLLETQEGTFSGQFMTPVTLGEYSLLLENYDSDGNLSIEKLSTLLVVSPIIVRGSNGAPIENAKIKIDVYNPKTRLFEDFPLESVGLTSPLKSDSDGTLNIILPDGKYKLNVSSSFYKSRVIIFNFMPTSGNYYPDIKLTESAFSIMVTLRYFYDIAHDLAIYISHHIDVLYDSYRFQNLATLLSLLSFSVLSLHLTAHRLTLKIEDLFVYVTRLARDLFARTRAGKEKYIAFVEGENGLPIHGATVNILQLVEPKNVQSDITSIMGEFSFLIDKKSNHELLVSKKGFVSQKVLLDSSSLKLENHHIKLIAECTLPKNVFSEVAQLVLAQIIRTISDLVLFFVLVFHGIYIMKFGLLSDIPILIITLLNLVLYIELIQASRHKKV